MDLRYARSKILFQDKFESLQKTKILILGVGGVGGFVLDSLYRTGVTDITIVDCDIFDETNQNRQIGSENIGEIKVEVLEKKYKGIKGINQKIDKEWVEKFDFEDFDFVIDAIDDISAKVEVAKKCYKKLISSMGGAKRIDPQKIKVGSIWKTYGDKFAKAFRERLKRERFNRNFQVVFSDETPKCKELGSFMGVTASFGLQISSLVIQKILEKESEVC